MATRHETLLEQFRAGRKPALARAISVVENEREDFESLLGTLHPRVGRAQRIGVTGPPGAGKSTLCAGLIRELRGRGESVGVIAVDPTSPFTGGALLGDRIRLNDVAEDDGVFIRSMASRGSLGGLAVTTGEVADVMDAFGFDRILLETVGVGQSELDIAGAADTTVVVLVPESGDSIQAMKAGLMEVADLFVVNKADRPGALRLARDIQTSLRLRSGQTMRDVPAHHGVDLKRAARGAKHEPHVDDDRIWSIPVIQTVAEKGDGVPELLESIDRHRDWLERTGELHTRRRKRLAERVREVVARSLAHLVWRERGGDRILEESLADLESGRTTPYQVAARIVRETRG